MLTRREFFSQSLQYLRNVLLRSVGDEDVPGRLPLSALKEFPDSMLMDMTPALRPGWTADISDINVIYTGNRGQHGVITLRAEGCAAARLFNGALTLTQVASEIETQLSLTRGSGASIARDAFLVLAEREIYHPSGSLDCAPDPTRGQHA